MEPARADLIAAVQRVLDETEAQMPWVVRVMVQRGYTKRTGHDFASSQAPRAARSRPRCSPRSGAVVGDRRVALALPPG